MTTDGSVDVTEEGTIEEHLEHHGIKGMRWGVRRANPSQTPQSGDYKKVAKLKSKPAQSLSNKQLKTVNERGNLETQFSRLNPSKKSKGKLHAKEFLEVAGLVTSIYALSTTPLAKKLMSVGKKQAYKQLKFKGL